jgi:thioredoxin 1
MEGNLVRTFDTPIITNDQSIDRVLAAGLPVVLVFLDGQPPAQLAQLMDRLAREYAGKLLVAQIQVKDNPATKRNYQINSTPGLITIRNGQVLTKAELISAADLEKHGAYLMDKGPKPAPARKPETGTYSAPRPQSGYTAGGSSAQNYGPRVVTDANFDKEVLGSAEPVLVDFWAPWCGPCKIVEPTVEKLAKEQAGRLRVVKVNADENPVLVQRYGIQGIPTMLVVKNGQIAARWTGALPEPAIRSKIAPFIN